MTHSKPAPIPRLFTDMSHLWPLLSPPDYYVPEAHSVDRVLSSKLKVENRRPRLLEMGAGGGHTLHHLADHYDIVALDLSEGMLKNCKNLNPNVETVIGDMRTARLDRDFDAVLIHDSVDYLLDQSEVLQTLETASIHLCPGSIILVAPTYVSETFIEHDAEHDHHSDGETDLTYFTYVHRLENARNKVETILVYLIRQEGKVRIVEDRNVGGLFSTDEWIELLNQTGFDVELDHLIPPEDESDPGVPMFIGIKT
ncbi:MAG: class I SAM-dependent methyltransferase [Proteobacteria bacterium]|nr:class I SAM-dependent methyltransferase [Pseudomonadota bacterium]